MANLMQAVDYKPPGLVENLSIAKREIPKLRNGECLVKVFYSGINRADTLQRKGHPPPPGDSDILGLEAAGCIWDLGSTSGSRWKKHDRVMALVGGGGNAEYVAVNEKHLIRIPDWMSYKEAAAIPEAWLTAFQLLFWVSSSTVKKDFASEKSISDKRFLVHAAASGVGTSLIQLLKNVLGVKEVYATVGSADKQRYLEDTLKVTRAFNYKVPEEENFAEHILKLTNNEGVDVVFDCVAGSYWQKNCDCLAMDGEWVFYGQLGGGSVNGDFMSRLQKKRIHLKATTLRNRSAEYKHKLILDFEERVLKHFDTGKLKLIIDQVFDLEQIGLAHQRMESNLNIGKILLKVTDENEHN